MKANDNGTIVRADLVIAGTGPAGLALAHSVKDLGLDVLLLESGVTEPSDEAQELSEATTSGDFLNDFLLSDHRNRQLGGNASLWVVKLGEERPSRCEFGLRYGNLERSDFEKRDWVPMSGWPVSYDEIQTYVEKAAKLVAGVDGTDSFEADPEQAGSAKPLVEKGFTPKWFRFGPRDRYLNELAEEIEASPNVTVLCDHSLMEFVEEHGTGHVDAALVRRSDGTEVRVEARAFVLAAGGVENARILLQSKTPSGESLGNHEGILGRYYMDHPLFYMGDIIPSAGTDFMGLSFFDMVGSGPAMRQGYLSLDPTLAEEHDLLNVGVSLFPRPSKRKADAIFEARELMQSRFGRGRTPKELAASVTTIAKGADGLVAPAYASLVKGQSLLHGFGRSGWSRWPKGVKRFSNFEVMFQCEQAPEAENRVTLSDQVDRFGYRKAHVEWRLGEQTRQSVLASRRLLAERVDSNLGKFVDRAGFENDQLPPPSSMAHHMGSTRMAESEATGVVDKDCRLFEADNVYCAGSSVFPTGGSSNPTLMIVALSLRLGDIIEAVLGVL